MLTDILHEIFLVLSHVQFSLLHFIFQFTPDSFSPIILFSSLPHLSYLSSVLISPSSDLTPYSYIPLLISSPSLLSFLISLLLSPFSHIPSLLSRLPLFAYHLTPFSKISLLISLLSPFLTLPLLTSAYYNMSHMYVQYLLILTTDIPTSC